MQDFIKKPAEHYSRCDTVRGRYFTEKLKKGLWDNGISDGLNLPFSDSALFTKLFEKDFPTNVTNKTNFNEYLAQKFFNRLMHNVPKWSDTL